MGRSTLNFVAKMECMSGSCVDQRKCLGSLYDSKVAYCGMVNVCIRLGITLQVMLMCDGRQMAKSGFKVIDEH